MYTIITLIISLILLAALLIKLLEYSRILPAIRGFQNKEIKKSNGKIVEYVSRYYKGKETLIPVIEFTNEFSGEVIKREFYNCDIDHSKHNVGGEVILEYIESGAARINDPLITPKGKFDINVQARPIIYLAGALTIFVILFIMCLIRGF